MKIRPTLLAALALAGAAFAQSPAGPAPAPAPAPALDPAQLALAHETIKATHADKLIENLMAQIKQMIPQLTPVPDVITPGQQKYIDDYTSKAIDLAQESTTGLLGQMDQVYASVLSESELKALKAFYDSPEGQSFVAKQPQLMQKMMPLLQGMQRELMPKIQALAGQMQAALKKAREDAAAAAPKEGPGTESAPPAH